VEQPWRWSLLLGGAPKRRVDRKKDADCNKKKKASTLKKRKRGGA